MNDEGRSMTGKQEQSIRQETIMHSYLDEEVPVLYLADGTPYLPVRALCRMLGLRPETHIPRWRKLVLWANARKLPLRTARGERVVWCLHAGALTLWFVCFDWSLVAPERYAQLQQAVDEGTATLAQTYQNMLTRYQSIRHHLFAFLTAYADIETTLPHFSVSLHVYLNDFAVCIAWEDLISQGKALINEATTHARRMLREQAAIPVVDAVKINMEGDVVEELALPLFPVVREEDIIRFFENLGNISQWYQQMRDFLGVHGMIWDEEQKKWDLA